MQQMCAAGMHTWFFAKNLKVVGAKKEWNPAHFLLGDHFMGPEKWDYAINQPVQYW